MKITGLLGATALVATMGVFTAQPAAADVPAYAKVDIGTTLNGDANDAALPNGQVFGGALGIGLSKHFRVEAGIEHVSGDFLGGVASANAIDVSGSVFFDLPVGANSAVFVGGGADYVQAEVQTPWATSTADSTGYHYGAGFSHDFGKFVGEVSWSRLDASDFTFDDPCIGDQDLTVDRAMVAIRMPL